MISLLERSPNPDGPVLVLGGAGVDIVGRLKEELRERTSTQANIRYSWGGVARNVAENLARLGLDVNLITVVGQDETGERLLRDARSAGVNIDASLRCDDPTGTYLAVVDAAGGLKFGLDDMRVLRSLSSDYIRDHEDLFRDASLLFVDSNLPKKTLRTAMSLARKAKLPVCADPTAVGLASRLLPYLDRLFMITPNSSEAAIYCEDLDIIINRHQALEAARHLVSHGVQIVVITLGEEGLTYATPDTSGYIPALRTTVVDPTGAGDALSATIIFAMLNDIPLDEAVRLAVSSASLTLRYPGAVVPDLSLEKLYDQLVI
jgi:pseudouridine kinase